MEFDYFTTRIILKTMLKNIEHITKEVSIEDRINLASIMIRGSYYINDYNGMTEKERCLHDLSMMWFIPQTMRSIEKYMMFLNKKKCVYVLYWMDKYYKEVYGVTDFQIKTYNDALVGRLDYKIEYIDVDFDSYHINAKEKKIVFFNMQKLTKK